MLISDELINFHFKIFGLEGKAHDLSQLKPRLFKLAIFRLGSQSKRIYSLQAWRGIAALAVVFYHVHVIAITKMGTSFLEGLFKRGNVGVDFFFVLSGYIIAYIHLKDARQAQKAPEYLLKRVLRIFPLLTVINLIKVGYIFSGLPGVPQEKISFGAIFSSFLLLPHQQAPLVDVAWTLRHEMLFYLLFTLVILFPRKLSFGIGIFFVAGTLLVQFFQLSEYEYLLGFIFSAFNIQFLMGVIVAGWILAGKALPNSGYWLIGALIILAILLGDVVALSSMSQLSQRIIWGLIFSVLVAASVSWELDRAPRIPKWLQIMGDASFSIYLFHTSFQMLFYVSYQKIGRLSGMGEQIVLFSFGVLSILGGLIVWFVLEQRLNKVSQTLLKAHQNKPS